MKSFSGRLVFVLCIVSTLSHSLGEDVIIRANDGRVRGVRNTQDSDFVLGGLFAVHSVQGSERSCQDIRCRGGTDRVEAMLFAIDQINNNPLLLPNLTLSYDIRDTCSEEHIGLDEASNLILSGTHHDMESKNQCNSSGTSDQGHTVGLIGAGASRVSIPIAGLTRLFEVPQISYSSTSAILSNRERYSYFFRTIPSDTREAVAIIDMLRYFNWTFISTVFTRDSYGQSGIDDLHDLTRKHGICIDISEGIEIDFSDNDYRILAEKIANNSEANVIVVYTLQEAAQRLLKQFNLVAKKNFTWIATSAWVQSIDTVVGLFGVLPTTKTVDRFSDYFSSLTEAKNTRNPWFSEFLQCNYSSADPDYAIPRVIDAVYTFAHALDKFLNDNCAQPLKWIRQNRTCVGLRQQLTGSVLLDYIKNTSFTGITGMTVSFDSEGGVEPLYDIVNYQQVNKEAKLKCIGVWSSKGNDTKSLEINNDVQIHFGVDATDRAILEPIESHCGRCKPGQYLRSVPSSCCGLCEPCLGQNFSNASVVDKCSNCSMYGDMWGNSPTVGSSGCVAIPQTFLDFTNPWSIVVMITSIIGLILLFSVVIILGVNWNTPFIRASARESMIMIVIGTAISFIVAFIYVAPPSLVICTLQRICLWLGFGLIFSSLTVKVIRITRIFVFQKYSFTHLKCMTTPYIILQTILLFMIQVVIVLVSLLARFPAVVKTLRLDASDRNRLPEILITCTADHEVGLVISIVYETALVVTSAVLATLSFKSPSNFNEAKSICCAAFGLLIIWICFFPTYFALQNKQELQNAAIAGTVNLTAYVVLLCLLGPRVFITLFFRKKKQENSISGYYSSDNVIGKGEKGEPAISLDTQLTA